MTSREAGVPVGELREAARRRVAETNLRSVAAEIGLSYSGLRAFLNGTEPFTSTVAKLRAWYGRTEAGKVERKRAALRELVEDLPESERERAMEEIRAVLRKRWKAAGKDAPEWAG